MSRIAAHVTSLSYGIDPAAPYDDLADFGAAVADASVVGLGEAIHGIAEFYVLKHRLFSYLVEKHGFRVFALESGFVEGLVVDAWLRGASELSLDDILRTGFTYNMGCCEEFAAQLEWMRSWNVLHPNDPLRFLGTDLPAWLGSMAPAVDRALAFLSQHGPRRRDDVVSTLGRLVPQVSGRWSGDAVAGYSSLADADRTALTAALDELVLELSMHLPSYDDVEAGRIAVRCAQIALEFDRWLRVASTESPESPLVGAPRDLAMAQTVLCAVMGGDRVVFGAHNGHLQCVPMLDGLGWPAGAYLRAQLGAGYVAVGTAYGAAADPQRHGASADDEVIARVTGGTATGYGPAPAGTLDALLAGAGEVAMVDLRRLSPDERRQLPQAIRMQGAAVPVNPAAAFDVVVGVATVSPMTQRAIDRADG